MTQTIAVLSLLSITTYTDLKKHKIYNKTLLPFLIIGLIYQCIALKTIIPLDALYGFIFPLVLLPFFALNMIGAGDIKLYMVVGIWLGFMTNLNVIVYSFLVGGLCALILLIVRKNGLKRLMYFLTYLKSCFIAFKPLPYQSFDDENKDGRFPFAVVIFIGYLTYLVLGNII